MKEGVLYWITGLSGAGKTTIGTELYYSIRKDTPNVILLDGDVLKKIVGGKAGYTNSDRRERAGIYSRLCKALTDQGMIVICCTIAMFDDIREWNRKNNRAYVEVFLDVPEEVLEERDQKGMYSGFKNGRVDNIVGKDLSVELPKNPDIIIKNDGSLEIKECVRRILNYSIVPSEDFRRDTGYWNDYYQKKSAISTPSLFAGFALEKMKAMGGDSILELGCGNGRDSLFFAKNGYRVIAIDASDKAINELQKANYENDRVRFLCDDFVCSSALFMCQYDYCYSRFSLHAINAEQEKELLVNVYTALKKGGLFFIEVRSVNDSLYGKGEKIHENAYKYNGHYRRFAEKNELISKLQCAGFAVEYAEESTEFAPYKGENPPVIRIVCKKLDL